MNDKKLLVSVMGGTVALALLAGAAASFAQTDEPTATTTVVPAASVSSLVLVHNGGRGGLSESDQALADALGIDLAELEAAEETARIAMIDQALADGLLTEEEAAQLKELGSLGRGGHFGYDKDEYLADALGITVEELQAAELVAYQNEVDAAVAAGTLTQEEADLMLARKAAQNYLDEDALNAAVRSAYEDAVAAAVAAGDITQAQADALLAEIETQTFNFGFGGHGGRGHHGGRGGLGLETLPETSPETTPDTTTDTSFDA